MLGRLGNQKSFEEQQKPMAFGTSKKLTFQTAIWSRSSRDISVIRLQFPQGTAIVDSGHEHQIIAPGATYRSIAQAIQLCHRKDVVLWISGHETAPKLPNQNVLRSGDTLLIAHRQLTISLNLWRKVRSKLVFVPRQWFVPTSSEMDAWTEGFSNFIDCFDGAILSDGATHLFHLCPHGLNNLSANCWFMQMSPDEVYGYASWNFAREDKGIDLRLIRWNEGRSKWPG